jgi:hypothetical protein
MNQYLLSTGRGALLPEYLDPLMRTVTAVRFGRSITRRGRRCVETYWRRGLAGSKR